MAIEFFIAHEQILPYAVSNLGLLGTKFHEVNALPYEMAGPGNNNPLTNPQKLAVQ